MKKYIPNILTTYRFITSLLLVVLYYICSTPVFTILFLIALLTDALDGFLARRWDVESTYGRIMDIVSDKLIVFSSITIFVTHTNPYFYINLGLELLIVIINITNTIKSGNIVNRLQNHKSSIYGKAKTWFIFITLFVGYLSLKFNILNFLVLPLIIFTAIAEIITAIGYIKSK